MSITIDPTKRFTGFLFDEGLRNIDPFALGDCNDAPMPPFGTTYRSRVNKESRSNSDYFAWVAATGGNKVSLMATITHKFRQMLREPIVTEKISEILSVALGHIDVTTEGRYQELIEEVVCKLASVGADTVENIAAAYPRDIKHSPVAPPLAAQKSPDNVLSETRVALHYGPYKDFAPDAKKQAVLNSLAGTTFEKGTIAQAIEIFRNAGFTESEISEIVKAVDPEEQFWGVNAFVGTGSIPPVPWHKQWTHNNAREIIIPKKLPEEIAKEFCRGISPDNARTYLKAEGFSDAQISGILATMATEAKPMVISAKDGSFRERLMHLTFGVPKGPKIKAPPSEDPEAFSPNARDAYTDESTARLALTEVQAILKDSKQNKELAFTHLCESGFTEESARKIISDILAEARSPDIPDSIAEVITEKNAQKY